MDDPNALFKLFPEGPVEVTGNFRIVNAKGKIVDREGPIYLCRCGGSSNKPYCDDTHRRHGFTG